MIHVERFDEKKRPKVGVSLLVVREFDGKPHVLLGQRKGSHGEGEWGTPGGHQEFGENCETTALCELVEECGPDIKVSHPRYLCTSNLTAYTDLGKHYLDVAFVSHWISGDPKLMEPEECTGWLWHPMDSLPTPLFAVVENLAIAFRTGQPYFA